MPALKIQQLQTYLESQVIGQPDLVKQLLIALLADGHILVEGPPGLAKTRAVKILADSIEEISTVFNSLLTYCHQT